MVLDVVGLGFGNGIPQDAMLSRINECRSDINIPTMNEKDEKYQNCQFVGGLVNGWPSAFLITTKKIVKGAQLFTNYGQEYGLALKQHIDCATKCKVRAKSSIFCK